MKPTDKPLSDGKKCSSKRRTNVAQVMLNPVENELLIAASEEAGVSKSEFGRTAIVAEARKVLNQS